jgi:hypothetical protein
MAEYGSQDAGRLLRFTGERDRPSELEDVAGDVLSSAT